MTVAVLPTIWLVNRERDGAGSPNVASAGLPAEAVAPVPAVAADPESIDPMGEVEPRFLSGQPSPPSESPAPVVVGRADDQLIAIATATYRNDVGRPGACLYNGVAMGELVTIVNVDNGRSTECWTAPRLDEEADPNEVVLHPDTFRAIADLTDAPVRVEIRQ